MISDVRGFPRTGKAERTLEQSRRAGFTRSAAGPSTETLLPAHRGPLSDVRNKTECSKVKWRPRSDCPPRAATISLGSAGLDSFVAALSAQKPPNSLLTASSQPAHGRRGPRHC